MELQRAMRNLAKVISDEADRNPEFEDRVREAVAILCEQGYMAELHKVDERTYFVTEHNCAIAHIARQYPRACEEELCFLTQILRADVQRHAHILKGDLECTYRIQFPSKGKPALKSKH